MIQHAHDSFGPLWLSTLLLLGLEQVGASRKLGQALSLLPFLKKWVLDELNKFDILQNTDCSSLNAYCFSLIIEVKNRF